MSQIDFTPILVTALALVAIISFIFVFYFSRTERKKDFDRRSTRTTKPVDSDLLQGWLKNMNSALSDFNERLKIVERELTHLTDTKSETQRRESVQAISQLIRTTPRDHPTVEPSNNFAASQSMFPPLPSRDSVLPQTTPQSFVPVLPSAVSVTLHPRIAEVIAAFNQMMERPDIESRNEFFVRFGASFVDGMLLTDTHTAIAWIPLPATRGEGLLVPGHDPVRDWAKSYRGVEGARARSSLEPYFEIELGATLQLIQPARAQVGDDGRITEITKGQLLGR